MARLKQNRRIWSLPGFLKCRIPAWHEAIIWDTVSHSQVSQSHRKEGNPLSLEHLLGARPCVLAFADHYTVQSPQYSMTSGSELLPEAREICSAALLRAPGWFSDGPGGLCEWPQTNRACQALDEVGVWVSGIAFLWAHPYLSQPALLLGKVFIFIFSTFLFSKLCSRQVSVVIAQ